MKLNCYSILPANVRYDKKISAGAKLLYAELTAASSFNGEVEEDVKFFCEVLDCDSRTYYRYRASLLRGGYIEYKNKLIRLPMGFQSLSSEPVQTDDEDTVKFYNDFFIAFEKGFNCYLEKKELYYPMLRERLSKFSKNELMRALENRAIIVSASEWHNLPEHRHNATSIELLIRDDKEVHKWLNMPVEKQKIELKPFNFT